MCGIVGYIGNKGAAPILLEGLKKLEYRGYDSAGIAVKMDNSNFIIVKETGRISNLVKLTNNGKNLYGNSGIGHTRWATNGKATLVNAHPHTSSFNEPLNFKECDAKIVGVHNGIIENSAELKQKLEINGYKLYSETDSEVLIKLIDYYFNKYNQDPFLAISKTMLRVKGSYALEIMFKSLPEEIWVARKDSPMVVGINDDESFIASDIPAILKFTKNIYSVDNFEIGKVKKGEVHFYNLNGEELLKETKKIELDSSLVEKSGYEHFMMKEIHEEPSALSEVLKRYTIENEVKFDIDEEFIKQISLITIVGCGSSYNAAKVAQYVIEDIANIPVDVKLSSEFRDHKPILRKNDLVIFISRSGETSDTLASLRLAKKENIKTIVITNDIKSSLAKEGNFVLDTCAGEEIAVTTTKCFSNDLIVLYLLAIHFAHVRDNLDEGNYLNEIRKIPSLIELILKDQSKIQWLATKLITLKKVFFIGRNTDFAISLEGSLKLKEICYIHSEAFIAGEMRHGSISLLEEGTAVIGVLTQSKILDKTLQNLLECKKYGAYIVGISTNDNNIDKMVDYSCYVPKINDHFEASLICVVLQLLSYYGSVAKGFNADRPIS